MSPKFIEESDRASEASNKKKRRISAAASKGRASSKGNTSSKGSQIGGGSARGSSVAGDIGIVDDPNDDINEDMYSLG